MKIRLLRYLLAQNGTANVSDFRRLVLESYNVNLTTTLLLNNYFGVGVGTVFRTTGGSSGLGRSLGTGFVPGRSLRSPLNSPAFVIPRPVEGLFTLLFCSERDEDRFLSNGSARATNLGGV